MKAWGYFSCTPFAYPVTVQVCRCFEHVACYLSESTLDVVYSIPHCAQVCCCSGRGMQMDTLLLIAVLLVAVVALRGGKRSVDSFACSLRKGAVSCIPMLNNNAPIQLNTLGLVSFKKRRTTPILFERWMWPQRFVRQIPPVNPN